LVKFDIKKLLEIMARLRDAENGCPWDVEQTFRTIAPYTIEEAYEVVDAIERGDTQALPAELGDLLLQVVFHARMAEEKGWFDFGDVVARIADKMVRRHPHVFGDAAPEPDAGHGQWERLKADERAAEGRVGVLDGIALALPGLTRAAKLGQRAARVGFDWPDVAGVRDKLDEEISELDVAMAQGDPEAIENELGDVFFVLANLCRRLGIDPEQAIRGANTKFARRFAHVEKRALEAGGWTGLPLERLEGFWQEVKSAE
jgi:ATP diphosphatase